MNGPQRTLRLTLTDPYGPPVEIALPIGHVFDEGMMPIKPLSNYFPGEISMDQAVEVLRKREYRRDLFKQAATQLGLLLSNRLEDKEGWHGEERRENAP